MVLQYNQIFYFKELMIIYRLFNISFLNGDYHIVIEKLRKGGLMVVPSGPGLATIGKDLQYTKAVQNADFAIPDSRYMILLLNLLKGIRINKLSGYDFLFNFFKEDFKSNDLFLIDPNKKEANINNLYLNEIGVPIPKSFHYIAPLYKREEIKDQALLDKLNSMENKPNYIMINLGSNVQEPLGYYLKKYLTFKPAIICTGAAISFFTGSQTNISPLIDKIGLGWLMRCIDKPSLYIPRYIKAFKLLLMIIKTDIQVIREK